MKKCSLLNFDKFIELSEPGNNAQWFCPKCLSASLPFAELNDIDYDLELAGIHTISNNTSLKIYPEKTIIKFIDSCHNVSINEDDDIDGNEISFHSINSKYYDLHELIQIIPDPSSIGILHTNLASIYKYHHGLVGILSLFKFSISYHWYN